MKHFLVKLKVSYDDAHKIPEKMDIILEENVVRCIERHELLNDPDMEAVVETWSVEVDER